MYIAPHLHTVIATAFIVLHPGAGARVLLTPERRGGALCPGVDRPAPHAGAAARLPHRPECLEESPHHHCMHCLCAILPQRQRQRQLHLRGLGGEGPFPSSGSQQHLVERPESQRGLGGPMPTPAVHYGTGPPLLQGAVSSPGTQAGPLSPGLRWCERLPGRHPYRAASAARPLAPAQVEQQRGWTQPGAGCPGE